MAEQTKIQWTDHTFNPWIGCSKVHEGCRHCYAEADMDKRRGRVKLGPQGTRSMTSAAYWRDPLKWNRQAEQEGRRHRVFCASLADVFEDWTGPILNAKGERMMHDHRGGAGEEPAWITMDDLRRDLFALIDQTPWLDWLLLTKRSENIRRMWPEKSFDLSGWNGTLAGYWYDREWKLYRPNVWLLTSISDQATADRMIPPLLECRDLCPVLGVSAEPLLGPVDLEHIVLRQNGELPNALSDSLGDWIAPLHGAFIDSPRLDWVIIGGESGPNARPCNLDWIRSLVGQCRNAGVAAFVKQVGSFPLGPWNDRLADSKGGDMAEWPADLRVREFPNG